MLLPSDAAAADGGGNATSIPPYVHPTSTNSNSYEPGSLGRRGTTMVGHNVATNNSSISHNSKVQTGQYPCIVSYHS